MNRFNSTLRTALTKLGTTADVNEIVSTVRDKLLIGDALSVDNVKKVVTKLLPQLSFPALGAVETSETSSAGSETSDDMSVGSIVSVPDFKSGIETLTAATTSSTDGDMSSLDLTAALSTPRSTEEIFHSDGAGHVFSPRGGLLSPRGNDAISATPEQVEGGRLCISNTTISFPTPKADNRSSSHSNSTLKGNAMRSGGSNDSAASSHVREGEAQLVDTESSSAAVLSTVIEEVSTVIEEGDALAVLHDLLYGDLGDAFGPPPINGPSLEQLEEIIALIKSDDFEKRQNGIYSLRWHLSGGVESWTEKEGILNKLSKLPLVSLLGGNRSSLTKVTSKLVVNIAYEFGRTGEKNTQFLKLYKKVCEPLISACLDLGNKRESSFLLQFVEFISSLLSSEALCCEHVWFASLLTGKIKTSKSDITKVLCLYTLMIVVRTRKIKYSNEVLRHVSNNNREKESLLKQIIDVCKVGLLSFGRWYNGWTSRAGNSELRETYVNAHYKLVLAMHAIYPNEMNDVVQGIENGRTTKKKEFNEVKVAELAEWGVGGSMRAKFGSLPPREMPSRR